MANSAFSSKRGTHDHSNDSEGGDLAPTIESWIAPSFTNSWANYSATPGWAHAGYYKDTLGTVHLKGLVKTGTPGTTIFVLPAGYRPEHDHIFVVQSNSAVGRVDIYDDGRVLCHSGNSASWTSLGGITFKAEQ